MTALKAVDYSLLGAIFAITFLPSVYGLIRISVLGSMPDDSGFNIASQISWLGLFYEVMQEFLVLPLFFILGKSISNRVVLENKVKSGLIVVFLVYGFLSLFIHVFARNLITFMLQAPHLIDATVTYIRFESVAALFAVLWRFVLSVLITLGRSKEMYILLFLQAILSIFLDVFLISSLPISLKLGVNGIAITNIIVNVVLVFYSFYLLQKHDVFVFSKTQISFRWVKEWFSVGIYSGIESLVRNIAFAFMIIRMVNLVAEQKAYWLANSFIWQWLLIPGLALGELVKKEVGENSDNIQKKTFGYLLLSTLFALLWIVTIPLWKPFLQYVMNIEEYEVVLEIAYLQIGFYVLFLFNNSIIDSTFYGLGKTKYMLIQSIVINVFYYGSAFVLYLMGVFIPSMFNISLMFGIGMALDCIPAVILYKRLLRRKEIAIEYL